MPQMDGVERYRGAIGSLLRRYHEASGLTQQEFARELGHGGSGGKQIWNIINNGRDAYLSTVFLYCRALGPEFAEDVADLLYQAAMEGVADQRNRHLAEAQRQQEILKRPRRPPKEDVDIHERVVVDDRVELDVPV